MENRKTDVFDQSWQNRKEACYNHWIKGTPRNQVQLAFRCHWNVFSYILEPIMKTKGRMLEVGAGRGTLGSCFANDGWNVTLLDYSFYAIEIAKKIYCNNGHKALFVQGDVNELAFHDNTFKVIASIGLLEHFKNVKKPILEQYRALKPGGWFLGYIVSENPNNIQRYFRWFNKFLNILSSMNDLKSGKMKQKEQVYRSTLNSERCLRAIEGIKVEKLIVFGMYPLPLISHSPEFPFTLLPAPLELLLSFIFKMILVFRKLITGKNGWICSEKWGQAFLLAFQKPIQ